MGKLQHIATFDEPIVLPHIRHRYDCLIRGIASLRMVEDVFTKAALISQVAATQPQFVFVLPISIVSQAQCSSGFGDNMLIALTEQRNQSPLGVQFQGSQLGKGRQSSIRAYLRDEMVGLGVVRDVLAARPVQRIRRQISRKSEVWKSFRETGVPTCRNHVPASYQF